MRRLQCALLAAVAAIGFVSVASAADMPIKGPVYKAAPVAIAYNWSGIYGGVSLGWMHDSATYTLTNPVPATIPPASMSRDSGVIGGHIGAQYQWSNIVLGVEFAGIGRLSSGDASKTNCYATGAGGTCLVNSNNLITAGGRLGWAWNDWMIYGSGGWAQTSISTNFVNNAGVVFDNTNVKHNGWYAGVGVDYLLLKGQFADLITGLEYQHIDFGTKYHASSADGFGPSPPGPNGRNVSLTGDIVRLRLMLKFNPFR